MTDFSDHFWGDKNNGFDVLYHNMKHGQDSSKEFVDFLRESCTAEETYGRLLAKIANSASKYGTKGSFSPYWQTVKTLIEKLSNLHLQLVYTWQDLMKDVQRYNDEQHKKHKAMKDSESSTLETVQLIQQTVLSVHKAKETYHARCLEFEKLRRDGNASPKDLEKAEAKYKKAMDDYQSLVDKYASVRKDFETKMIDSCKKFQKLEEFHLHQMKDFVDTYSKAWEHQYVLLGKVHEEFQGNSGGQTAENLLQNFINSKTTGKEKPGPIEFVEADLSSLPAFGSTPELEKKDIAADKKRDGDLVDLSSVSSSSTSGAGHGSGSETLAKLDPPPPAPSISKSTSSSLLDGVLPKNTWFLSKRRREKKKKKKSAKEKEKEEEGAAKETQGANVDADGFEIDEEGYRIRRENDNQADRDSWDSSTDSDSDNEERRKIKVEIKPLSSPNGQSLANSTTNNVHDIEKAITGLRLSPTTTRRATPTIMEMKKSTSLSDSLNTGPPSHDLLGLDLFVAASSGNLSTPTTNNVASSSNTANTPDHETGDLSGMSELNASAPLDSSNNSSVLGNFAQLNSSTPTNTSVSSSGGVPLLTGPPAARTSRTQLSSVATARPTGRQSPALSSNHMERADSVPSLSSVPFNTSTSYGSSRGPSPLTIGMSDSIPLAVAYSERLNSLFKGTDEAKCKCKMAGEMMVSFPAGIVRALTENPNPSTLSFRLKNTANIQNILVNKQLLIEDTAESSADCKVYNFNMNMLTEHLRRQTETNKSASYFNIDILKYEIRCLPGVQSTPLHLVSFWKCEKNHTDFRLDYKYNASAFAHQVPLSNVTLLVPVDGDVTNMLSKPTATWSADNKRATWKLGEVSDKSEDGGRGCLRAKFDVANGPSHPSQAAAQFLCEGHTLSGIDFELLGTGYRISLIKKRLITGRYISEADQAVYV